MSAPELWWKSRNSKIIPAGSTMRVQFVRPMTPGFRFVEVRMKRTVDDFGEFTWHQRVATSELYHDAKCKQRVQPQELMLLKE